MVLPEPAVPWRCVPETYLNEGGPERSSEALTVDKRGRAQENLRTATPAKDREARLPFTKRCRLFSAQGMLRLLPRNSLGERFRPVGMNLTLG